MSGGEDQKRIGPARHKAALNFNDGEAAPEAAFHDQTGATHRHAGPGRVRYPRDD